MALAGKVAVVTGNTAVALGAARALGKEGVAVAIAGWSQGGGELAAKEIATAGGKAEFIGTDVSRTLDIRRLASRAESDLGPVTILVNAAETLGLRAPLMELYEDEFDDLLAVNLRAAFLLARTFVPGMIQAGGGHVVNVVAGGPPRVGAGGFYASRAGLVPFTQTLAAELRPHSIRVNAVDVGDPIDYEAHSGTRSAGDIPDDSRNVSKIREVATIIRSIRELCDCPADATGQVIAL